MEGLRGASSDRGAVPAEGTPFCPHLARPHVAVIEQTLARHERRCTPCSHAPRVYRVSFPGPDPRPGLQLPPDRHAPWAAARECPGLPCPPGAGLCGHTRALVGVRLPLPSRSHWGLGLGRVTDRRRCHRPPVPSRRTLSRPPLLVLAAVAWLTAAQARPQPGPCPHAVHAGVTGVPAPGGPRRLGGALRMGSVPGPRRTPVLGLCLQRDQELPLCVSPLT